MTLHIGDKLQIQCYKHNGKIHRAWDEAVVLDVKKDYIVFGNKKTNVTEAEGSYWKTKEPAILYFFKDRWFNVIAQLKKDGIYYYCNIATPFVIEEKTIKYIDYDLDLRILDRLEYKYHKRIMHYSEDLDKVINLGLRDLIEYYKEGSPVFNEQNNKQYYKLYKKVKEEQK